MIPIAITAEAFAAIEATLPLGTVGVEPKANENGERLAPLERGQWWRRRAGGQAEKLEEMAEARRPWWRRTWSAKASFPGVPR